jgi:hypothetical protein
VELQVRGRREEGTGCGNKCDMDLDIVPDGISESFTRYSSGYNALRRLFAGLGFGFPLAECQVAQNDHGVMTHQNERLLKGVRKCFRSGYQPWSLVGCFILSFCQGIILMSTMSLLHQR